MTCEITTCVPRHIPVTFSPLAYLLSSAVQLRPVLHRPTVPYVPPHGSPNSFVAEETIMHGHGNA